MNQPLGDMRRDWVCRACYRFGTSEPDAVVPQRCPDCGNKRIRSHEELFGLSIAHVDCDAFFATVEKRDRPELADQPVIVGGGKRGVVTAACYVARTYGVRSAMPMFKALKACPHAIVIHPSRGKYTEASKLVRAEMEALTPLVQPLSIDEAFLDLSGTQKLHRAPPAATLAKLAANIEKNVGITVSIGLSHNKFLAKIASDLDKPRGFAVIGRGETKEFLAKLPASAIWGVGPTFSAKLSRDGINTIGDIQHTDIKTLASRYGDAGFRLSRLSSGQDDRPVRVDEEMKSVSSETTFFDDLRDREELEQILWELSDKVSFRMKTKGLIGGVVTLTLKTSDFKRITRRKTLDHPTNLARRLFETGQHLLQEVIPTPKSTTAYRLIGIGFSGLSEDAPDTQNSLFADPDEKIALQESVIDKLREKFGKDAIGTGRELAKKKSPGTGQKDKPGN